MAKENNLEKLLDTIGGIAALVTVVTLALRILNITFNFLPEDFMTVVSFIQEWGALIVVGITGWEFVANKGLLAFIIYAAFVALIVVFMFFPATYANIIGSVA